jgi:hypothetical protein
MRRFAAILTDASGIVFGITAALFPASYFFTLVDVDRLAAEMISPHSFPLPGDFRCAIYDGGIWLFNHEIPYTGGLMYISDDDGRIFYDHGRRASMIRDWRWELGRAALSQSTFQGEDHEFVAMESKGDIPGISYRHFRWMKALPWFTFTGQFLVSSFHLWSHASSAAASH